MDPQALALLALTLADEAINFIKAIKGQSGLSADQLAALADQQDLQNKDDLKKLLAL